MAPGRPGGRTPIKTADPVLRALFVKAEQLGVTSEEIAVRIDRTPRTISNWKRGLNTPTMFEAHIFAQAIGCSVVVTEAANGGMVSKQS